LILFLEANVNNIARCSLLLFIRHLLTKSTQFSRSILVTSRHESNTPTNEALFLTAIVVPALSSLNVNHMSDSGAELDVIHPTPASNSGSPQTFQETTSLADLTSYQMDEDYYIESTFMIFQVDNILMTIIGCDQRSSYQVENCLFRVPTYIFVEAPVFAGMFKLPQSGINTEGSSSDNPIMFPSNILSVDFENLLEALFPL